MAFRIPQLLDRPQVRFGSLGLAAFAVCLRTLGAGFVQWDDGLLTDKLALHGLSLEHLRGILIPSGMAWQPVRDLTFALTYAFSGSSPWGYHLVNTFLYVAVAILSLFTLDAILSRAGFSGRQGRLAAWTGALLFTLHPLHVEAFAWVQGNKDLLAGMFFLGAFIQHGKAARAIGRQALLSYAAGYFLFILALCSKPSAAAFPLVVLAFDLLLPPVSPDAAHNPRKRLLALHLPYWVPAAALAAYFIFFTGAVKQTGFTTENFLVLPQILAACYRLAVLPVDLLHRYPDPQFAGFASPSFWTGSLITAGALAFVWINRRKKPAEAFGMLWFFLCWLPQSNIIPVAIRVADRYLFLSLLGLTLVVSVSVIRLSERLQPSGRIALWSGFGLILAFFGLLSVQRAGVWKDGLTLWSTAARNCPKNSFFQLGLAQAHISHGELDSAAAAYERALALEPGNVKALVNLGYTRKAQGHLDEALSLYERALFLDSGNFNALNSSGNILAQLGRDSLAAAFYERALLAEPDNYMARVNLASLLRRTGRESEADSLMSGLEQGSLPQPVVLLLRGRQFIQEGRLDSARSRFERALTLDRELTPALAGLGEILLRQDSAGRALEVLREVKSVGAPDWGLLHNLGLAFSRLGQSDSALAYYRLAWLSQPDSLASALDYAVALASSDSLPRAIEVASALAGANPGETMLHYNLGNWLLRLERYNEAADSYRAALKANPKDDKSHLNLGLLYMRFLGQPDSALAHLEASLSAAPAQPQAQTIRNAIELLKRQKSRAEVH